MKGHFGVIIPLSFDTILKSNDVCISPDQTVRDWLKKDSERFHSIMDKIEGKDEYVIQISYIPSKMNQHIVGVDTEATRIKLEMADASPGIAYILKQKL